MASNICPYRGLADLGQKNADYHESHPHPSLGVKTLSQNDPSQEDGKEGRGKAGEGDHKSMGMASQPMINIEGRYSSKKAQVGNGAPQDSGVQSP